MSDPLPILAHGESYAQPVQKKTGGGSKPRPHEYEEARNRLLANIGAVSRQMQTDPDSYLEEKVVCIRMEPKFEAKSYAPSSVLTSSDELQVIGGRRYKTGNVQPQKNSNDEDAGEQLEFAKLYFLRTTSKGLADFENALRTGSNESDAWRNEVMSIRSFDLLEPGEKILGFDAEWKEGLVEAVLHPLQESAEDAVDLFCKAAGLGRDEIEVRSYKDGVTFIAAQLSREATMAAARINPLRTVHPMGRIAFEPIRSAMSAPAPQVAAAQNVPPVTVGVFDGGCNPNVPLLSGYVNAHDAVASLPDQDGIDHGTGVCGAVLHGELSGKGASDVLPAPEVKVESFRVLPPSDPIDIDLYESIDAIEYVVGHNPDIQLYNLSFGPAGPILDDDISRFTYALDVLSYNRDAEPPLFCIAAGNDGDLPSPDNRVQSPADLVNGIGVGAFCILPDGTKARAPYSCVGPGREGAKIKPDLLEYGGDINKPFVVVASSGNALGASAGTSFASPLLVHKLGRMMSRSEDISQHLARALVLHNSKHSDSFVREEYGFGIAPDDPSSCLSCDDNRVTTLYQGMLRPKQLVSLPIFAPGIESAKGLITISWTIVAVCETNPNDSDAYTSSCIVDTLIPHANKYTYSLKGTSYRHTVNLATEEGRIKAAELELQGYTSSTLPVSKPAKKYWEESELRANDMKWDSVISRKQRMKSSSLYDPKLTLQSLFRNNNDPDALTRYYAVVTVDAPGYNGSLYNSTLQEYRNLQPIKLRIEPRLEARS